MSSHFSRRRILLGSVAVGAASFGAYQYRNSQRQPIEIDINGEWRHDHHPDEVEAVEFSQERVPIVISSGRENEVIAVELRQDQPKWEHTHNSGSLVRDLYVEGETVLNSGTGNSVVAANLSDGSLQWEHSHHDESVYEVSASSEQAFSGDAGGVLIASDLADGSEKWIHTHHTRGDQIRSVHYDDGDDVVLSTGYDHRIIGAEPTDGSKIWELEHGGSLKSVDKVDEKVYLGLWQSPPDAKVQAVDWESQEIVWEHEYHDEDSPGVQELHAAFDLVASAGDDQRVVVVDAETGELVDQHTKHDDAVRSVHIVDGDFVVSGSRDGKVIVHEIKRS